MSAYVNYFINSAFRFFVLLFLLSLCAGGCVKKTQSLLDDESFINDLRHSGTRGAGGITIVAPSSGMSEAGLEKNRHNAQIVGINFPPQSIKTGLIPYNANSDKARLDYLHSALMDPETEVIWAMRGGYGSSRLLDALATLPLPKEQKIVIGYSDITFLHLFLHKHGWRTVHGSMFAELPSISKDKRNLTLLAELLAGKVSTLRYDSLAPFNNTARQSLENINGVITGGNLTCLAAAAGTPWFPDGKGKILFLEDVQEPGYKIDRMLTQLRSAGLFDGLRAVLLGEFTQGDGDTEYALARFANELDIPVFRTDLFGHGEKNYPLILNAPAVISRTEGAQGMFSLSLDAELPGK